MDEKILDIYYNIFKDYPDVLNIDQVSRILDVSTKTVYKIIKEGALSAIKVGRGLRVPKYFLLEYLGIINSNDIE